MRFTKQMFKQFMIQYHLKMAAKQVVTAFLHPENYTQSLFVQLSLFLLRRGHGSRGKCNRLSQPSSMHGKALLPRHRGRHHNLGSILTQGQSTSAQGGKVKLAVTWPSEMPSAAMNPMSRGFHSGVACEEQLRYKRG